MNKKASNPLLRGISLVRRELSHRKMSREVLQYRAVEPLLIGSTKKLEILPLYEAVSTHSLQCGFGVSYLIRTDGNTLLFDLGNNPTAVNPSPLEENMSQLGVSLKDIDGLLLSHRHPDHVGGMNWWKQRSFSLSGTVQPNLGALPVYVPERLSYPDCHPILTKRPIRLAEGVATTGSFTFYEAHPLWQLSPRDCEQTVAVNVEGQGIVLIVGCGHMGLEALLNRSKRLFNSPIIGIVGGLHYWKSTAESLQSDINTLKALDLKLLALSPHDSFSEALQVFEAAFADIFQPIRVGETITLK